ncbi:cell wall protein RBR3 [Hyalella azteca]|uniref:Cell wall protein RBR3 n=1 Tax=Hyalella azteca TaxID=294128 RepID=A0A8B7P9X3_HYAAZ|nr:cell wall protein RBR3 [Hyalella azteca]XP_047738740.1 cell wall protein RBR3 [Hyalella azteca]
MAATATCGLDSSSSLLDAKLLVPLAENIVATPASSVISTSPSLGSCNSSSSHSMMVSPTATPTSPSLTDAAASSPSSSTSTNPGPISTSPSEQERVLDPTVLIQLKELDLAIQLRDQNRVDGRKTRWIEHRRRQEEQGSPGSISGASTGSNSSRKRRSGGSVAKHKKENIDVSSGSVSPIKSSNSSPSKTDDPLSFHESTPHDNNNITPLKFPPDYTDSSTMKIEVSEPLVGSVEPSNVLQTMKQQFLQDTTKETVVDSAKLINTDSNVVEISEIVPKKKKTKSATAVSLPVGRKKIGRPAKKPNRVALPNGKEVPGTSKVQKKKVMKSTTANGNNAPKKVLAPFSNFFMKAKTRGLRDVRKPDGETPDGPSLLGDRNTGSETELGSTKAPIIAPIIPSKCLLIAATAKVLSNKGAAAYKKKSSQSIVKLSAGVKTAKKFEANGKFSNGELSSKTKTMAKVLNKKSLNKNNPSDIPDTSISKDSEKQAAPYVSEGDSSESANDASRRGRSRGSKRKLDSNSISPPPKWSRKTSTVVAEVHNSMNGEPQQSLAGIPKPQVAGRKRKPLTPVKGAETSINQSSSGLASNDTQSCKTDSDNKTDACVQSSSSSSCVSAASMTRHSEEEPSKISNVNQIGSNGHEVLHVGLQSLTSPNGVSTENRNFPVSRSTLLGSSPRPPSALQSHSFTNGVTTHAMMEQTCNSSTLPEDGCTQPSSPRKRTLSPVKLIRTGVLKASTTNDNTSPTTLVSPVLKTSPSSSCSPSAGASPPLINGEHNGPPLTQSVNEKLDVSSSIKKSPQPYTETKVMTTDIPVDISDKEIRTKSPTGSDCDNNNRNEPEVVESSGKIKEKSIMTDTANSVVKESGKNSDSIDVKKPRRPPRFLKALFDDEGVQNMLNSIKTKEVGLDGSFSSSTEIATTHKLRPKRPPEHSMAISPEPDLEVFFSTGTGKRKRKCNEVDSLYSDEGAVNMMTSCSGSSRRSTPVQDEPFLGSAAAEDISVTHGKDWSTRVSLNGNEQYVDTAGSVIAKRKPGRPQKQKSILSKSCSPSSAPDIVIESEISIRKKPDSSSWKPDDANGLQLSNVTKNKVSNGHEVRIDYGNVGGSTNLGLKANVQSLYASSVVSSNAAISVPSSSANAHRQGNQSPVKIRRIDLPTSPTMASLDSLVRSMDETSGVVPTSSVAFVPNIVPEDMVPPVRGMRGLMTVDGGISGGLRQSQRCSVRQTGDAASFSYRDLVLRKMNNFVHIIMAPQTTKIKNSLNSRILRELCDALNSLRGDPSVRLVLLTSNGSSFCQGVDLTSLHHAHPETRNNHAQNLARAIKEFLRMLVQFPKPIIAGVNGNAVGLGVTMLPLFDLVYASDSAEFYLPYSKLGQVPEGGATYTFPALIGKLQATRLFMGYKFSAREGVNFGLVSEVLWPANFQEMLLPKVALLATQSSQSMETTKALMNHQLQTRLELSLENECNMLQKQWISPNFETLSRRFLESHAPLMQKPVVVPL